MILDLMNWKYTAPAHSGRSWFVYLLLVCVLGIFSCKSESEKAFFDEMQEYGEMPMRVGKNIEMVYSEQAHVKVKITAPKMEEYSKEGKRVVMPEGVHMSFYDSVQNESSSMTAKYALFDYDSNIMEAQDDVIVRNTNGDVLNAEELIWDKDSAQIYSDSYVKIITKEEIINGEGFRANEDFTKYKIKKVKGIISIKDKQEEQK